MSTDTTQFDAKTDVTGHVTAPRCRLGSPTCNFEITYKDNDPTKPLEMYVTLPIKYATKTNKSGYQKYNMRSIIEAIQELNRRTATFSCDVYMKTAIDMFDTADNGVKIFYCDQETDGLPAATNGISELDGVRMLYVRADQFDITRGENVFGLWDYVKVGDNETKINTNISKEYQLSCTLHRKTFANSTLNTETCIIDRENSPVDQIIVVDSAGNKTVYYVTRFYRLFNGGRLNNTQNGQPPTIVKNITLKDWSNEYIVDMSGMFINSNQTTITFENFNTSKVIYMTQMFINAKLLPYIDISKLDTNLLRYSESMFNGCSSLETIYMGNFTFNGIAASGDAANMFKGVPSGAKIYINSAGVSYIMDNQGELGIRTNSIEANDGIVIQ